jgi:hypothetical protein
LGLKYKGVDGDLRSIKDFIQGEFTLVGGSGEIEMAVDGSSVTQVFAHTVPATEAHAISRCLMQVIVNGPTVTGFASGSALTNGILVDAIDADGNELADFTPTPIKDNHNFLKLAGVDALNELGAGLDVLPVRWTLRKAGFLPVFPSGSSFRIHIRDDLTDAGFAITTFLANVQGFKVVS